MLLKIYKTKHIYMGLSLYKAWSNECV